MAKKILGIIICVLIITSFIAAAIPMINIWGKENSRNSSPIIEYKVGTSQGSAGVVFSPWMADGAVASVTSNIGPTNFSVRIRAPGRHIEYQIGTRWWPTGEVWSPLMSDGNVAGVTTNTFPATIKIRIIAPGYHVKYQIGTRWSPTGATWSPWMSDGDVANITTNMVPTTFSLRALMIVPLNANIDIDPNTLNLKSKGKWITTYIELSNGNNVSEINVSTVKISDINNNTVNISAESHPTEINDYDNDTIPDLMVKFDRSEVQNNLSPGNAKIIVSGKLNNGTVFEGSDTIRVIKPGK